jgi:hypothetical protein
MLCISWPAAVIEEVDDGTLGEGRVVCRRRDRGRACHESRVQAVFFAGRQCGHGEELRFNRKQWIKGELQKLAGAMGIDLLGFSWWMRLLRQLRPQSEI